MLAFKTNSFFLLQLVLLAMMTGSFLQIHAETDAVVDAASFGAIPGDQRDTTPTVFRAMDHCRMVHARKLTFPPGRYDFWPDRAHERYFWICNNDPGLKRIAFDLRGFHDFEIDGQGAEFVFHGFVMPFLLEATQNITLKNFSIDWARTFHSEAKIEKVNPDEVELSFTDKFPYKIENGLLIFTGEGKTTYPVNGLLEFSAERHETAFQVVDYWKGPNFHASEIAPGRIKLLVPGLHLTPGNILVFGAAGRDCPAITLSDSTGIEIESVNIYHAGGMGVIAQRCTDVSLDHVEVVPAPGSDRMISASADATHFVNCKGKITMTNCRFTNQEDDATNIHGVYAQITAQISPTEIEVKLVHPQQFGFDFIRQGMKLQFTHGPSMIDYGTAEVKSVERLNDEYTRVVLNAPVSKELVLGDVVSDDSGYPDVVISHCYIGKNRARGLLLGSRGKVLIEDNTFHTPGAAILLEGDARFWFEQSGVRSLTIRHNIFDQCNYGTWGNSVIQVGSGIVKECQPMSRYNRNVLIEDNTFKVFDSRILNGYSIDGLIFRNNTITTATDYPALYQTAKPFEITSSDHIEIHP